MWVGSGNGKIEKKKKKLNEPECRRVASAMKVHFLRQAIKQDRTSPNSIVEGVKMQGKENVDFLGGGHTASRETG